MFSTFFKKIVPFMRECGKMWWSQRGRMHYDACALRTG